jgi:hypothetical protein
MCNGELTERQSSLIAEGWYALKIWFRFSEVEVVEIGRKL